MTWRAVSARLELEDAGKNVVPLAKMFKSGGRVKHVQGTAAAVSKSAVTTAAGEVLPYDVLVIASGARYPEGSSAHALKATPGVTSGAARVQELRDLAAQVATAKVGALQAETC